MNPGAETDAGTGTEPETDEPGRAVLERHLDHEDCDGLDRTVVIELGEVTARTTVFEAEGDDWVSVGAPVEHKLRSRPDVDHRADLAIVADQARAHIEVGIMTDYLLTGHDAGNGRVDSLFRERLGADRVFTPRSRSTTSRGRLALVGAGVAVVLIMVGVPIVLALDDSTEDEAGVLGSTTERSAAAATTAPPTAAPTTAAPTTAAPTAAAPTPPTTLGPIDLECRATVFAEPGGGGRAWTFAAGEHDLLLAPRALVLSATSTGSGCQVQVCTEWDAGGTCEVIDEGTHDISSELADGVSYLRVG